MGGAPGRQSLCLFWRETQTKDLNSRSPARPEVEEERKVRQKTGPVDEERRGVAVDNGGQRKMIGFELAIQRMTESTEVRKATAKT